MKARVQETAHVEKGQNNEDLVDLGGGDSLDSQLHAVDEHVGAERELEEPVDQREGDREEPKGEGQIRVERDPNDKEVRVELKKLSAGTDHT